MSGTGRENLKGLLASVEQQGIAPLTRVSITRPKDLRRGNWAAHTARRKEVELQVIQQLAELGARIGTRHDLAEVQLGGIKATSRRGLLQALKNWRDQLERAIGKGATR